MTDVAGLDFSPTTDSFPPDLGELCERMQISVLACSAESCRLEMPVFGNRQPFGKLHGGASAALAETAASLSANLLAKTTGKIAVGSDLNISHLAPVDAHSVVAVATLISKTKSSALYRVEITAADGTVAAHSTVRTVFLAPL